MIQLGLIVTGYNITEHCIKHSIDTGRTSLIAKVHGANMGPIWSQQDPGGPHAGPMNFAIWDIVDLLETAWKSNEEFRKKFCWKSNQFWQYLYSIPSVKPGYIIIILYDLALNSKQDIKV